MTTSEKHRLPNTGATNRKIKDKLDEFISVKDFGAVGDYNENTGTGTNDTAAIQTAIDAVAAHSPGRGAVFIPAGAYKITSALQVPYGVSIFGTGGTSSIIHCVDCDGVTFTTYGYSIGQMFFEDFGLTAATGTNRTGILTAANAATMDGLKLHRLRLYGWDVGVSWRSNNECSIQTCVIENVNTGIAISSGNGTCTGIRVLENRIVHAAGGLGASASVGVLCAGTTGFTEAVFINSNKIYGFGVDIKLDQALYVTVLGNDLSSLTTSITYTAAEGEYNICDNYIECQGGRGIVGAPQGSDTTQTKANIQRNYFQGTTGATIGLQLNTTSLTYSFNASIIDNTFIGFSGNDILLYAPGRTHVSRNRCMSTAPTNSIFIGGVIAGPVQVTDNWCVKALFLDNTPDLASGLVTLRDNTESNTFKPRAGSAVYDPTSLANGAGVTTTVTCSGATLGEYAKASFSLDLQGVTLLAWVSGTDTVSVRFQNNSGGTVDLGSGTIRVSTTRS